MTHTPDIMKCNAAVTAKARLLAAVLDAHWTGLLIDNEQSMEIVQSCLDRYRDAAEMLREAIVYEQSLNDLSVNPRQTRINDGRQVRPPTDAEVMATRNRPQGGTRDRPS